MTAPGAVAGTLATGYGTDLLWVGLLTAAARDTGTTVVLVTHEARVAAYSDREAVVRDGRVREQERAR